MAHSSNRYRYQALPNEGRYIRLLRLLPGGRDQAISGELSLANLDALEEPYIAVSYTWGPRTEVNHILLEGRSIWVRNNLYDLLRTFRQPDRTVTLWLDAICIDQASLKERNHQVGSMGDVFGKAERVYAWLGLVSAKVEEVLDCIPEIAEVTRDPHVAISSTTAKRAERSITIFQRRTYWSRIWIVQELVLAKDITLFWGVRSVGWKDLLRVLSLVDKDKAPTIRAIEQMRFTGQRTFEDLFAKFGYLECTLDHDKFYSLYGMMTDTTRLRRDLLLPDYNLCVTEVFMQQLSHWNLPIYAESPMSFITTFIRYFSQQDTYNRECCACHRDSLVAIQLPFRGIVKGHGLHTRFKRSNKQTRFSVHSSNDIYRFRQVWAEECDIQEGDLAFELGFRVWNLVARAGDPCLVGGGFRQRANVLGLLHHGNDSKCKALSGPLCGLGTAETTCLLYEQENVLFLRTTVRLLMELASVLM